MYLNLHPLQSPQCILKIFHEFVGCTTTYATLSSKFQWVQLVLMLGRTPVRRRKLDGNPGVAALVTSVAAILIDKNHVSLSEMNFSLEITMKKWSALLFDFFFAFCQKNMQILWGYFVLILPQSFTCWNHTMWARHPTYPHFRSGKNLISSKRLGCSHLVLKVATRKRNACNKSSWGASKHLCLVYHAEQE